MELALWKCVLPSEEELMQMFLSFKIEDNDFYFPPKKIQLHSKKQELSIFLLCAFNESVDILGSENLSVCL